MKRLIKIGGLLLIAALLLSNWSKTRQIDKLTATSAALPPIMAAQVEIKNNKIISKVRQSNGKVKGSVIYIPQEGKVEIKQPIGETIEIKVKRAGLAFAPAAQLLAGKDIKMGFGARFFYFNRYGAGLGVSNDLEPYLFADRRLDDILSLLKNTTIGIWGNSHAAGVLVSVYL